MPKRAKPAPRAPVTDAGKRTRDALLDAGGAVAESGGLAALSVNAVVAEAGVAKGTFYVHFTDREAFLDALHERFYANIAGAIDAAVDGLAPGAESLAAGIDAYLDACLAQRAVKPVLRELHGGNACTAATARSMGAREATFPRQMEAALRAMGAREAAVTTRLLVAMISETALLEIEAKKRAPAARKALRRLVELAATSK
jgi:TetR/AcrR family transcriptional regulator, transcriptional repressor for nem operon